MVRHPLLVFALALASVAVGSGATAATSPAGAARGGVLTFSGHLDASQVFAGSASPATGQATITIDLTDPSHMIIATDLVWSDLTGPADRAHLHSGPPGQPTNDLFFHEVINSAARTVAPCWETSWDGCAPTSGSLHDEIDITDGYWNCLTNQCIVDTAVPNGFYLDMHTELYPGGEIRGQLTLVKRRPDARVRVGTWGAFTGDDVYNRSALHQQVSASGRPGSTLTYQVSIQNDTKTFGDTYRCVATGSPTAGYKVTYLQGVTDITSAVVAGTYHTPILGPGQSLRLTVRIKLGARAMVGSSIYRKITVTSDGNPARADAVKVTAKRA